MVGHYFQGNKRASHAFEVLDNRSTNHLDYGRIIENIATILRAPNKVVAQ